MRVFTLTDTTDLENVKLIFLTHRKKLKQNKFDKMLFDVMNDNPDATTVEQISNLMVSTYGFHKVSNSQLVSGDIRATRTQIEMWNEKKLHTHVFFFILNETEVLTVEINDIIYPNVHEGVLGTLEEYLGGIPVLQELPGDNAVMLPLQNPEHPELIGYVGFPIKGVIPIRVDDIEVPEAEQQSLRERFMYLVKQIDEPMDLQIDRAIETSAKDWTEFSDMLSKSQTFNYEYPVVIELQSIDETGKTFKFTFPDFNHVFILLPGTDIATRVNSELYDLIKEVYANGGTLPKSTQWSDIQLEEGQQVSVATAQFVNRFPQQVEELTSDFDPKKSLEDWKGFEPEVSNDENN